MAGTIYWAMQVPSPQSNWNLIAADCAKAPSIGTVTQQWTNTFASLQSTLDFFISKGAYAAIDWFTSLSGSPSSGLTNTNIAAGSQDSYLNTWATACAAWGKPLIIFFCSEMNGNWYPAFDDFRTDVGNSAGSFKSMWNHVTGIFDSHGCTNVTWALVYNIQSSNGSGASTAQTTQPMSQFFSTTRKPDLIGLDGFNTGGSPGLARQWLTFDQVFSGSLAGSGLGNSWANLIALDPSIPCCIGSFGTTHLRGTDQNPSWNTNPIVDGNQKSRWLSDAFVQIQSTKYSRIKLVRYYNTDHASVGPPYDTGAYSNGYSSNDNDCAIETPSASAVNATIGGRSYTVIAPGAPQTQFRTIAASSLMLGAGHFAPVMTGKVPIPYSAGAPPTSGLGGVGSVPGGGTGSVPVGGVTSGSVLPPSPPPEPSFVLEGTVTKTSGSPILVGSGTRFTIEAFVGQVISVAGSDPEVQVVSGITDDTHMTMGAPFTRSAVAQLVTIVGALPASPGVVEQEPYLLVTANGTPLAGVLGATIVLGLDVVVGSATVELAENPHLPYNAEIEILAGAGPNNLKRFKGLFKKSRSNLWPHTFSLICRGMLSRADKYRQAKDAATPTFFADRLNSKLPTTGLNMEEILDGADATDENYIIGVLNRVPGLNVDPADIKGTGHIFGSLAYRELQWNPYVSALAQCQKFDEVCLGYRLFESLDGRIMRSQVFGYPNNTADVTFTEGVDVWSATGDRDIEDLFNGEYVEGYALLGQPGVIGAYIQESNDFQSADDPYIDSFSSPLIEDLDFAQQVAEWRLGERNREQVQVELLTFRDNLLIPGRTIAVNLPHASLDQPMWIQHVEITIRNSPVLFQQSVRGFGGGLPDDSGDGAGGNGLGGYGLTPLIVY